MILNKWADVLAEAGSVMRDDHGKLREIIRQTEIYNPWFTEFHCDLMLRSFTDYFFAPDKLNHWLSQYPQIDARNKIVGLVLAGNIPFVGMHDIICTLATGNTALIKMSSKDTHFFPYFKEIISAIDSECGGKIQFTERLKNFDAVIATGSNNSARYFNYYFKDYPHLIRKNRTSVAIIRGDDREEQLAELGKDVFYYYGLGCRNVSKIYIPADFEVEKLFPIWESFRYVADNSKYQNNYDYNRAILLLNNVPHLANDFFMIIEDERIFSRLATIHYERYENEKTLQQKIIGIEEDLQCVVAASDGNTPFGMTQFPELDDYADHTDTVKFLNAI